MASLFDYEDRPSSPNEAKPNHRQEAEKAYRALTANNHAKSVVRQAGRNASAEDLKAIAFAILEEAKLREPK